jgi:hypothetical protein
MAAKTKPTTTPYVRGTQDISENRKTFEFFWDATVWSVVSIFVVLIILAYFFTGSTPAH